MRKRTVDLFSINLFSYLMFFGVCLINCLVPIGWLLSRLAYLPLPATGQLFKWISDWVGGCSCHEMDLINLYKWQNLGILWDW